MRELLAVEEAVSDGLQTRAYIDRHGCLPVCQFVTWPSFGNPVAWDVVDALEGDALTRLYRSCWLRSQDKAAFRSPESRADYPRPFRPTIEVGWVAFDRVRVEPLVAKLAQLRVPLAVAEPRSGLDGITFELAVGGSFCGARIKWWGQLPRQWRKLGPVVSELTRIVEAAWVVQEAEPTTAPDSTT